MICLLLWGNTESFLFSKFSVILKKPIPPSLEWHSLCSFRNIFLNNTRHWKYLSSPIGWHRTYSVVALTFGQHAYHFLLDSSLPYSWWCVRSANRGGGPVEVRPSCTQEILRDRPIWIFCLPLHSICISSWDCMQFFSMKNIWKKCLGETTDLK